jgi:hypothetical protein
MNSVKFKLEKQIQKFIKWWMVHGLFLARGPTAVLSLRRAPGVFQGGIGQEEEVAELSKWRHGVKAVAHQHSTMAVGASVADGEPQLLLELDGGEDGVRHHSDWWEKAPREGLTVNGRW